MTEQNERQEKGAKLPPYIPFKSLDNFLIGMKSAMPGRIDKSVMALKSGTTQAQLLHALNFFELISSQGVPTERLRLLVHGEGETKQQRLKELLETYYPFLFQSGFDLETATVGQIDEQFSKLGATGSTVHKCVAFFLKAADEAGLTISPYISDKTKRAARTNIGRPKKNNRSKNNSNASKPEGETSKSQSAGPSWEEMLLKKFPEFDPEWTPEAKAEWLKGFNDLMSMRKGK